MTQIQFIKTATDALGNVTHHFDIAAPAYYDFNENFTPSDIDYDAEEILSIELHLELDADDIADGNTDLDCEDCDSPTLPYIWVEGHDINICLSHLPESSQAFILECINTNNAS